MAKPQAGSWVIHGDRGWGMSTLAGMMAKAAAAEPIFIEEPTKEEISRLSQLSQARGPLNGELWAFVIDNPEAMTPSVTAELTRAMDNPEKAVWILVADDIESLPAPLVEKAQKIHFNARGMIKDGAARLSEIAALEGSTLSQDDALVMMRRGSNTLVGGLHKLQNQLHRSAGKSSSEGR